MENLEFIEKVVTKSFRTFKFEDIPTPSNFEELSDKDKDRIYRMLFCSASNCHGMLFSLLEYFRLYNYISE